jgi:glycosyltransferase involved in cell wall biosynthesis
VLGEGRRDVVERAVARAGQRGALVTLLPDLPPDDVLRQADVVVAAEWPPAAGPPFAALQAMAVSVPVIVLEVEATAAWPALDPQTWVPRGFSTDAPLVISVDPRDEEHSLVLAIVRLAADARLRDALGAAGHTWWQAHARVDDAAVTFEKILREAVTLGPAAPVQVLNGGDSARQILDEIGVRVDFL